MSTLSRKYYIVCDSMSAVMKKRHPYSQQCISRNISVNSSADYGKNVKSGFECTVQKSPCAPEYQVHCVKTKNDGIKLITDRPDRSVLHKKKGWTGLYDQMVDESLDSTLRQKKDMVGLRVIACNKADGFYYPGFVSKMASSTSAMVNFTCEKHQRVENEMIIPMAGAIARPELQVDDYVLVRVCHQNKKTECYVPGIILATTDDCRQAIKFYTVHLYNGQREITMRKNIVKIGCGRFELALKYIAFLQKQASLGWKYSSPVDGDIYLRHSRDKDTISDASSQSSQSQHEKKTSKEIILENGKEKSMPKSVALESNPRSKSRRSVNSRSSSKFRSDSRSSFRSHDPSNSSKDSTPRSRNSTPRSSTTIPMNHDQMPRRKQSLIERPENPVPKSLPSYIISETSIVQETNNMRHVNDKDQLIVDLQYQLEKQKRKQLRQEQRLVQQARKINKIQRKLYSNNDGLQIEKSEDSAKMQKSSSETDTSTKKIKDITDGTLLRESSDLLSTRSTLTRLSINMEVLARWSDDGWYYYGSIAMEESEEMYIIRDSMNHMEKVSREDILTESEHRFNAIQPEDYVVGLHPKYVFSFAPGQVLITYVNHCIKVEFFDGSIAELTSNDVYKISKAKHDQVVVYIHECERHLIGKSIVARDDTTGIFRLGVVDSQVGRGQLYYVKWLDGTICHQNANHIFEVGQRHIRHTDLTYVLAPFDHSNMHYKPAEVMSSSPLVLQFYDGHRSSNVKQDQCFWLTKDYYINAINYIEYVKDGLLQAGDPGHS